mmetsp:Transcript_3480/g.4841  ORF Transcript_3480/g.4841 Transcript_3480/m.4841 type:complete len:491 (-) Transcript_3480:245-1717(-)|eukprot:CAMPEP_0184864860 /NCGR_PEP_ID=MMETSP0580-20130426/16127_1 /TAXON_ID=1118495 /ORGANISM="Dactyliosolen fragilissimus" /LENGTH=490 /DNA_ID=CAMNT_0027363783 /DNA_START=145 /DNA_END=1617 /DNA_ORIENTATION=+
MAYRLKSIRYNGSPRKILLQNENGPCPLLAAANALLLRGVIALPQNCVQNNVASINDVVNILADRALKQAGENGAHHVAEVLSIFPNLQYGMDVNPKFTAGPQGVEYTQNVTAFDLMGVDLVHGWLLDSQDLETTSAVGNKSYNELVEIVIKGKEAATEAEKISLKIRERENEVEALKNDDKSGVNAAVEKNSACLSDATESVISACGDVLSTVIDQKDQNKEDSVIKKIETDISEMKSKLASLSTLTSSASIAERFLRTTSHQLTYYGLTELNSHLSEQSLCVFFRNNHFATLTKQKGILYLLVTDLGYANVEDVLWEKLDNITGDTEYANENFLLSKPIESLNTAMGPSLSPEQMLAQTSITEADLQLALQLSQNDNDAVAMKAIDEEEGKLIAAATEASLKDWNVNSEEEKTELVNQGYESKVSPVSEVDLDREFALKLQSKYEEESRSEDLVRRIKLEENNSKRQELNAHDRKAESEQEKSACNIS